MTIKPCPFCGQAVTTMIHLGPALVEYVGGYGIHCYLSALGGCGADGPVCSIASEAVARWNDRKIDKGLKSRLKALEAAVMDGHKSCADDGLGCAQSCGKALLRRLK